MGDEGHGMILECVYFSQMYMTLLGGIQLYLFKFGVDSPFRKYHI